MSRSPPCFINKSHSVRMAYIKDLGSASILEATRGEGGIRTLEAREDLTP